MQVSISSPTWWEIKRVCTLVKLRSWVPERYDWKLYTPQWDKHIETISSTTDTESLPMLILASSRITYIFFRAKLFRKHARTAFFIWVMQVVIQCPAWREVETVGTFLEWCCRVPGKIEHQLLIHMQYLKAKHSWTSSILTTYSLHKWEGCTYHPLDKTVQGRRQSSTHHKMRACTCLTLVGNSKMMDIQDCYCTS